MQALDHLPSVDRRLLAVHDRAERVDRLAVQQDVDADEVARLVAQRLVVERGVAPRPRLQLVEEVEDDLGERQLVVDLDALGREVLHLDQLAAARLAQLDDGPRYSLGVMTVASTIGSSTWS